MLKPINYKLLDTRTVGKLLLITCTTMTVH